MMAMLMLGGTAMAQKNPCKPDADGVDKVQKTPYKVWGRTVSESNVFSNMINTSKWSLYVDFGRYGHENAIRLFFKKKEESVQNATLESKLQGEIGKQYYFAFSGDVKPIEFTVQHTSSETKTDNIWGGLVTTVTMISALTDEHIEQFHDRFSKGDLTDVRLVFAGNITLTCPVGVMTKAKEKTKDKFMCFYDYNANNKAVAPEEVDYNDLPPNPNVPESLPRDSDTGKISFTDVVEVKGASKDQLFKRARTWMTNYYKNEQFAINNKEDGRLAREGMFSKTYNSPNGEATDDNFYTISVFIRDGKYKYEVTDIVAQGRKSKNRMSMEDVYAYWKGQNRPKFVRYIDQQVYEGVDEVLKSLKAAMLTDPKEDW